MNLIKLHSNLQSCGHILKTVVKVLSEKILNIMFSLTLVKFICSHVFGFSLKANNIDLQF